MSTPGPRGRSYTGSLALPNGAATTTSTPVDLSMFLVTLGDVPITITAPALTTAQLANGNTMTYNVKGSNTYEFAIEKTVNLKALVQSYSAGPISGVGSVAVGAHSGTFTQATTTAVAVPPPVGVNTSRATLSVTVTASAVASIGVLTAGAGYVTAPAITIVDSGAPTNTCAATASLAYVGIASSQATVSLGRKLARFVRLEAVNSGSGNASGATATFDIEA